MGGVRESRDYIAIALVSAAVMLYEIGITRILSVVLWYHFAFLAVSLAMLGLGVPGVWYALRGAGSRSLERALIASAALVPLSIIVLFRYGAVVPWRTALAAASVALPMLALGSAVCVLLLQASGRRFALMYGADLLGATAGAVSVVPLMHVFPTPAIVAGAALLPALALVAIGRARLGLPALAAIVALLAWQSPLHLRYSKLHTEKDRPLFEKWTPTAHLLVFPPEVGFGDPKGAFGWGMGERYVPRPVEQLWLELDGSAGTPITRLNGPPRSLEHLEYDVTNLGYQLQPAPHVSVIGAGGGRDVLAALAAGASDVDAIELNPRIVDLVSNDFGKFSGDVYHLPGVHAVVGEGRASLTATARRYDLIQISLVDSWAATTAGAFALSENYLYTVEAYRLYWNRLTPGGIVSTSRWCRGTHQLEALRLAHLVRAALEAEGVDHPEEHVAIAHAGRIATVLVSRAPFRGVLFDRLVAVCGLRGFTLDWPAATAGADSSSSIVGLLEQGPHVFRDRGIDLSPPVDDRPFFFQNLAIFGALDRQVLDVLSTNDQAVVLLRRLMVVLSVVALVLFFLPFALRRRLDRGRRFWSGSLYFGLIGLGFMLVELPLIQRMVLYLGHPSHATTVVLSSVLLGSGLGAAASGRLSSRGILAWALALPLLLAAANLALRGFLPATMGWPWLGRAAAAFAIAGLMGFFMGPALPLGMSRFGESTKAWFWAINGACGVVASVVSLALSMTLGFERVLWLGVAMYLGALFALISARGGPGAVRLQER